MTKETLEPLYNKLEAERKQKHTLETLGFSKQDGASILNYYGIAAITTQCKQYSQQLPYLKKNEIAAMFIALHNSATPQQTRQYYVVLNRNAANKINSSGLCITLF